MTNPLKEFGSKSEWSEFDLDEDLINSPYIKEKCLATESYCQRLYATLCNNVFQKTDVVEILKSKKWYCSWRRAGGIVSEITQQGSYMSWYCSGIAGHDILAKQGYITEGSRDQEILDDLKKIGWHCTGD